MIKTDTPNIFSGSSDSFCASLTFPTELAFKKGSISKHFPITDKFGRTYPDAETAYITHKLRFPKGVKRLNFYIKVAVAKFQQYPELLQGISDRGGVEWLCSCQHKTYAKTARFQWWEGLGRESPFISCLIRAYEVAAGLEISPSRLLDQPVQLNLLGE